MQTLLLTIASAIILAVAAAFAAPFLVDWTQWRSAFEAQATRVVGAPVLVRGGIDAELLPTPRLVLRKVLIGSDDVSTGGSVEEVRAALSLGALMRGEVVAEGLTLVEPRLRLVVDATGRIALPTGATRPAGFSVASLDVENGTLDVLDRGADRTLRIDDLDLRGDVGGTSGPFKLEGEVRVGAHRMTLRSGLGAVGADGAGKLRLNLQGLETPLGLDVDGVLRLAAGVPAFEGRVSVGGKADPAAVLPLAKSGWSFGGTVKAGREAIQADQFTLSFGGSDRPVELTGSGRLATGRDARLDLTLAARQIDLGAAAGMSPTAALNAMGAALAPVITLVPTAAVTLSADTLLLGGAPTRDLRAAFGWSATGWQVSSIEAKLPGRSALRITGATASADGGALAGTLAFESDDPVVFAGWAAPGAVSVLAGFPAGPLKLGARFAAGLDRLRLADLDLALGAVTRVGGTLTYAYPAAPATGGLEAALTAAGLELDPLVEPVRRAFAATSGLPVALAFTGSGIRLAGLGADKAAFRLSAGPRGLAIDDIDVVGLGGIDVTGSGRLAAPDAPPAAQFDLRLAGNEAAGLPALLRFAGATAAAGVADRLGATLAPLDLAVKLDTSGRAVTLSASGRLGALSGTAEGSADGAWNTLGGRLGLDIADGAALLSRFGIGGLRSGLGVARIEATMTPKDGAQALDASLALAGAALRARGTLQPDAQQGVKPQFDVSLEGADLVRFFPNLAMAVPAGGTIDAAFAGRFALSGNSYRIENLSGTLAGTRLKGTLSYSPDLAEPWQADLASDRLALLRLAALVTGAASGTGAWSDGRFAAAPLAGFPFRANLDIANLDLPGALVMTGARLRLRHDGTTATVDEISGALADGRLSANGKLRRRGEVLEADGHINASGVDIVPLVAAVGGRPVVKGRATLVLDLTGAGRTPLALAQALAGQGSLGVDEFDLAGADPRSLQYVMLGTERGAPPDNRRLVQLFDQALARGPLRLGRIEAPLSVIGGTVKTGTARVSVGSMRFAATGSLDLPRLNLDASLEMEDATDSRASATPGATLSWRGPLWAPERRLDVAALGTAINMRAVERETKRLEAVYGRSPVMDAGASTGDPAPSPGSVPETPAPPPAVAPSAPERPSAPDRPAAAPDAPAPRAAAPPRPRLPAPVRPREIETRVLPPPPAPFQMPGADVLRPPAPIPDAPRNAPSFP
ncbi:AsmA family protein [Ancylobacter terrae]|uniref:AsmA family protein n=1 Tax=Ancylobacter sp. sgz301288 TaxID=3342077 RepID=UPI00385D52E0